MLNRLLSCNFMLLGDPSDALVDDDIQGEHWLLLLLLCDIHHPHCVYQYLLCTFVFLSLDILHAYNNLL